MNPARSMPQPLVTVGIPAHNAAKYIAAAVVSAMCGLAGFVGIGTIADLHAMSTPRPR